MNRVVVVTVGSQAGVPIAYFSSKAKAEAYIADVLKRYEQGKALALNGKHLAPEFGNWKLGLGPQAHDKEIDNKVEFLPGAWSVRVDEQCRMVGCDFTLEKPPHHSPNVFKVGRDRMFAVGYGRSPQAASASARTCMRNWLNLPAGRHR